MSDLDFIEWMHDHRDRLHEISTRYGMEDRVTRGVALMVLVGYSDAEVYADLGHEILVWDGQHNPLREVPEVLTDVRRLVADR
jgi:hypothetical protein